MSLLLTFTPVSCARLSAFSAVSYWMFLGSNVSLYQVLLDGTRVKSVILSFAG